MFTINNKTNGSIGPYNGTVIAANDSFAVTSPAIAYIGYGTLLSDVITGLASITFAGTETKGAYAAQVLLQLGQLSNADSDGATYARTKVVPTGMAFCLRSFELKTSTIGSLLNNDQLNQPQSDVTVSFYDAAGNHLTGDTSACVKTVADYEPTHNYYIIGGQVRTLSAIDADVRAHVVAVPDVPAVAGGSIPMVQNINLRYTTGSAPISADGRAGKPLTYNSSLHTNKIRFIFYHPEGCVVDLMIMIEIFK